MGKELLAFFFNVLEQKFKQEGYIEIRGNFIEDENI